MLGLGWVGVTSGKMFIKKVFARSPAPTDSIRIRSPVPVPVGGRLSSGHTIETSSKIGWWSVDGRKQEDRIIFGEKVFLNIHLFAVIDGHGGTDTADYLKEALPRVVSMLCRERFRHLTTLEQDPDQFQAILKTAFKICADEWDGGVHTTTRKLAGAVATAVLVQDRTCVIAHVGDCRIVAATASAHAELTEEHRASFPAEKERIESKGGRVVSGRVRGLLSPSRAFGDLHVRTTDDGVILDCITPEPDLSVFQVDLDGFLILSTDGVNDVVPSSVAAGIVRDSLKNHNDASLAAKELAFAAQKLNNDDISVIVLSWQ